MPGKRSYDSAVMSLRGRIGGHMTAALHSPVETTAKAREAFKASFEHQVDPDGALPAHERTRRAEQLRRAHFSRLAYLSAQARRERVGGRTARG